MERISCRKMIAARTHDSMHRKGVLQYDYGRRTSGSVSGLAALPLPRVQTPSPSLHFICKNYTVIS